ncbi:uncharacterized protein LOC124922488 [Impatiens glandulifera]|uniref:uncharacterized protein LOC124922488 n=1 Tax=Impatiens glandulifera TaxID=253017 RepID=UPI001FB155EE|nr:uncharacterized protein LOC124922488 [Impatiens glandulifera]
MTKSNGTAGAGAGNTIRDSLLWRKGDEESGKIIIQKEERPKEPWNGAFAKSIVYAGLDAILTTFALISSITAGKLSSVDVLVLGVANLVADGISMGFGDFVSSSTEMDMEREERRVAEWDVTYNFALQKDQLLHSYISRDMDAADADTVVNIFSKYKDIFIEEKMGAMKWILPDDKARKPWKNGMVTFSAFIVFGSAPLLSFIVLLPFNQEKSESMKFIGAAIMSAMALALLGASKAWIAGRGYVGSVFVTLLNGVVAASAAYTIGWLLHHVAGLND